MLPAPYHTTSTDTKLAFLEKALQNNPQLQEEFLAFIENKKQSVKPTIENPETFIAAIAQELKEELEALDLNDPDWELYTPRHTGYIPEYEAIEHMNEDQVEALIDNFFDAMELRCREKRFDEAFLMAVGGYDACAKANLKDEYESLPDATGFMLNTLQEVLNKLNNLFSMVAVPQDQLFTIFQGTFIHSQKNYGDDNALQRFFEALLLSLITGAEEASIVKAVTDKQALPHKNIPRIAARVEELLNGRDAWEQTALQFFTGDKQLAADLLTYYTRKNDKPSFIEIANELWQKDLFRHGFADLYFEILQPHDDSALYKEVAIHLIKRDHDIRHYQAIRELLTPEERNILLEQNVWHKQFYAEALHLESRFEEALHFIAREGDQYNLTRLLPPFLQDYPARCLRIIKNVVHDTLEKNRGRNVYKRIAEILQQASELKQLKPDVDMLIKEIYDRKPALPALKDELKKAHLWPLV